MPRSLPHTAPLPPQTTLIDPLFNQLVIWDSRIPHGVREVTGTDDPLDARVVLQGWFTAPTRLLSGTHGWGVGVQGGHFGGAPVGRLKVAGNAWQAWQAWQAGRRSTTTACP